MSTHVPNGRHPEGAARSFRLGRTRRPVETHIFGQLAWFGVPVVPGVLVDGVEEAAGVGVAEGSGLAALTIAAPPTDSRPTARRSDAATRFTPEALRIGAGSGADSIAPVISASGWSLSYMVRSLRFLGWVD